MFILVVFVVVIVVIVYVMVVFIGFGECIVVSGGNEEVVRFLGINVDMVKVIVYMLLGLFLSIVGFIFIVCIGVVELIGG